MQEKQYRKSAVLIFILAIVFILLQGATFWNAFRNEKAHPGFLPFLFLLLALACVFILLTIIRKATNTAELEKIIETKVSEERIRILSELETESNEEKLQETEDEEELDKISKQVAPGGNFKNVESYGKKLLTNLANQLELTQGVFYIKQGDSDDYIFSAGYALDTEKTIPGFKAGENLTGQVAKTKEMTIISDIPDDYFSVESGLGKSLPRNLALIPIVNEGEVISILELSSFKRFSGRETKIINKVLVQIQSKINQLIKS